MCERLRETLPREYPGTTFYFLPADIVTQVLNFGLPAPIDIQIEGSRYRGQSRSRSPDAARNRARSGYRRCAHTASV